jgi:hypothetical protein
VVWHISLSHRARTESKGGKNRGGEKGNNEGIGTSGSHKASMKAILRICYPIRQDVRMQGQATLLKPGDFKKGLS